MLSSAKAKATSLDGKNTSGGNLSLPELAFTIAMTLMHHTLPVCHGVHPALVYPSSLGLSDPYSPMERGSI